MQINIDLVFREKKFKKLNFTKIAFIRRVIKSLINEFNIFGKTKSIGICILLTNQLEIKELNHEFLDKDKATNVLSFPDRDLDYRKISEEDFKDHVEFGDIAFCFEVLESESIAYGSNLENHFTHLLVHAILHLIGYDHQLEEDFEIMKKLEMNILKKLGIKSLPIYAQE